MLLQHISFRPLSSFVMPLPSAARLHLRPKPTLAFFKDSPAEA